MGRHLRGNRLRHQDPVALVPGRQRADDPRRQVHAGLGRPRAPTAVARQRPLHPNENRPGGRHGGAPPRVRGVPMNRTELRFALHLIPFLDSVEGVEDGLVKLGDRRWLAWHPDVMAALFRHDRDLRHPPSRTLRPLLGNRTVLWLDGEEHTGYRRTLAPMLRGSRYQALIDEMVERSIAELPSGDPVGLTQWTRRLTLRIIGRIVFGVDDEELLGAFTRWLDRWLDRRLGSRVRTLAHRYLTPGTTRFDPHLDRMLLHRATTAQPPALVAYLPPEDLRDQVVSLLFAGHETTASATAWTVFWIDRTPG